MTKKRIVVLRAVPERRRGAIVFATSRNPPRWRFAATGPSATRPIALPFTATSHPGPNSFTKSALLQAKVCREIEA
jgi:hypothetical protein